MLTRFKFVTAAVLAACTFGAFAQEAVIRKNLAERVPQLQQIDEISKTNVPGLYEIRANGSEIYYTDAQANHLFQGNLLDIRQKRNLTEERIEKLTSINFNALPLADAFTVVRGKGERKLAVFEDPNCGYCKRFERDLQKIDNVTVYMFLLPILGPDSMEKSKAIWCAKDRGQVWQDYMVRDKALPTGATCDVAALTRNIELSRKHRINGTPALIFTNNQRVPGAIDSKQVEQLLLAASGKE